MESEVRVNWGATILEGPAAHPNCDSDFLRRSILSKVLDLMPFNLEKVVTIQARDPKRRAPVSGDIWVESESEQRDTYDFLKGREGEPLALASVLKDLSIWLEARKPRPSTTC
jgi:hypothetical protein